MTFASFARPRKFALLTALYLAFVGPPITVEAQTVSQDEAHAIAVDAYVYFYSLVTMDVTRRQATNIEPGKAFGRGPMNMFVNVPEFPPANFRDVVRPNFDTLYSIACWT